MQQSNDARDLTVGENNAVVEKHGNPLVKERQPAITDLRDEADRRWLRVLELLRDEPTALARLIGNALESSDLAGADRYLKRLRRSHPPHPDLHELQAWRACLDGRAEAALEAWGKAVGLGRSDERSMFRIGNRLLGLCRPDLARCALELADDDARDSGLGRLLAAKCLVEERRWAEATMLLERFESFGAQRGAAMQLLYRCYMSDFRHEAAESLCRSMAAEELRDTAYLLGKALFRRHDFGAAIDSFSSAIDNSDHGDSKVWLIRTLYAISEHDDASAQAQLVAALPDSDPILSARCWEAAGRLSMAAACYREATLRLGTKEAWLAATAFHLNYRDWGEAWRCVLGARRAGAWSPALDPIRRRLRAAFRATGVRAPRLARWRDTFDFRSSERMVSGIVDRVLANPPLRRRASVGKPRKTVIVINSLGPGGAERQAVNLANGLVTQYEREQRDDAIELLCTYLSRRDQDCFYLSQLDSRVRVAEYFDRSRVLEPRDIPELAAYEDLLEHIQPPSRLQLLLQLAERLIELEPGVVHGWLDETFINVALVCRMLGIETVLGRWGSMPPGVSRTVSERERSNIDYLQHAYREIARLPRVSYSSNSRQTADAYAALLALPPSDVEVVYNGIDAGKLAEDVRLAGDLRATLAIPAEAPVVGTVFRMTEEKRPFMWLEAAAALCATHPDAHFIIVGTGPLEGRMQEQAVALGLDHVHFVGKRADVGAYLTLMDVFLLTSRVEGVSNAVVEAQLCGCPVVAADVGGLSEAILDGSTGILLDEPSAGDFADAVRALLDTPIRLARLAAEARVFAQRKFSVDTMVSRYRQLFGDEAAFVLDVVPADEPLQLDDVSDSRQLCR